MFRPARDGGSATISHPIHGLFLSRSCSRTAIFGLQIPRSIVPVSGKGPVSPRPMFEGLPLCGRGHLPAPLHPQAG